MNWKLMPLFLILAGLVIMLASWHYGTQHWLAIHTGTDYCVNLPSQDLPVCKYYGFWSGFGSDLGEYTVAAGIFTHIGVMWSAHTCHKHWWCWRAPRHQLEGTPYWLCGPHHPDDIPTVKQAIREYCSNKEAAA